MSSFFSWGNFPKLKSNFSFYKNEDTLSNFKKNTIPYGNGRSYGDSCLSDNIISFKKFNHFINYDKKTGLLTAQSGVLLREIIEVGVKDGWFLKINPGTKLITLGGAIASDVHGKNHHIEGCFSESVNWFNLILPSGEKLKCSRNINKDLFHSTCGGMVLTGFIAEIEIKLKKIKSVYINQKTIKTKNLEETFDVFETITS